MNLLSILDVLGGMGPSDQATAPTGAAPVPAPAPPPQQMSDLPPFIQMMIGRASVGPGASKTGKSDTAAASVVSQYLAGEQQLREAQQQSALKAQQKAAEMRAYSQGIAGVQKRLQAGDVDGAEAMIPALEAMGMKTDTLKVQIQRARTAGSLKNIELYPDLVEMVKADPSKLEQAIARSDERTKFRVEKKRQAAIDAQPKIVGTPGGGQATVSPQGEVINPALIPGRPEAFTIGKDQTRMRMGPDGKPQVVAEGPKSEEDTLGPKLSANQAQELGRAGINLAGRTHAAQITPDEWRREHKYQMEQAAIARAADKKMAMDAVAAGEGSKQLKTYELQRYVNPTTLTSPGKLTVAQRDEKLDSGELFFMPSPEDQQSVKNLRATKALLTDLENIGTKILAAAPGQNLKKAVEIAIKRRAISDTEARRFEQLQVLSTQWITRTVQGSRPSDYDAQQFARTIPTTLDTINTAVEMVKGVKRFAQNVENSRFGRPMEQDPLHDPTRVIQNKSGVRGGVRR